MLNLAGASFDFANVVFAVFEECEHRRDALDPETAQPELKRIADEKLARIEASYLESGGTPSYWEAVRREVLETVLPRYALHAIEQTRMERTNYDLWRGGDVAARVVMALIGLGIGVIIIAIPQIPIFWKPLTLLTAASGMFYPEIKKLYFDWKHSRLMNRLIKEADQYQKNARIHFVTNAQLDEAMKSLQVGRTVERDSGEIEAPPAAGRRN